MPVEPSPSPRLPELLVPAGNLTKLRIALRYGADAVYIGSSCWSLRAHAGFSDEEIGGAITLAHGKGVRVYVAVNIFAHNQDLSGLEGYLLKLASLGADGVIVADPGVLSMARRVVPDLPVHLSTQANVTNVESACFWAAQGASRLNLARELSLSEIRAIRKGCSAAIEVFVHGAVCISYSGRCLLSAYLTGRSANRGDCAHPCRYRYALVEEKRPGQFFPVEEDERGTYILNSRDLCLIKRLPELVAAGVDSVKIEGRMKSPAYVAGVVRVYRAALDWIKNESRTEERLPEQFPEELRTIGTRGYTENFFETPPSSVDMEYEETRLPQRFVPAGIVIQQCGMESKIEVRSPFAVGETVEYLDSGLVTTEHRIDSLHDEDDLPISRANPGKVVKVRTTPSAEGWQEDSIIRKKAS